MRKSIVAVLAAALLTGVAVPATAAPDRAELRQAMAEVVAAGGAGIQVRVHDGQGDWVGTAGKRELGGRDGVPANGRYRVGSITKTFVSTVILQLVGEGKIKLDDPADRYLPKFRLDKRITVRMLLQHTSGLFNYTGEVGPDGTSEPGIPLEGQEFVDKRFHTYRMEDLVGVSLSKPARFAPGTKWSYSNTNYVLAGLLIEKVTGTEWAEQVERRVLRPLGLRETWLPGTHSNVPGPHAHGYYVYRADGAPRVVDITRLNPSWGTSAGEIISTTADLDRFISALFGGKLLAPPLLAEMFKTRPIDDRQAYGLGLQQTKTGCGTTISGHTGGIHGYLSYLFATADGTKRFEFSLTTGTTDLTDPAQAQKLAEALAKVANVAACGQAGALRASRL
ncbi:D-alanyl-D-alanine carboxypeptidase [Amycolatopsis xylanica]|uniref:D-alanyl-D-alanine carboxypeptidase n=1 Tax=Amycolatopsis xylanica TaxID=589385 RepID=A0A1H3GSB2_9PSEU|nr:serine hydrolase domain-containing protein [Amycolatopsis xylanica]SDY05364.1 D-alanyl-D-alanine carboxypeptidase [Amycolatopsis xylanica]